MVVPRRIRKLAAWESLEAELWLTCVECGVSLNGISGRHEVGGLDGHRRWCRRCADAADLASVA